MHADVDEDKEERKCNSSDVDGFLSKAGSAGSSSSKNVVIVVVGVVLTGVDVRFA